MVKVWLQFPPEHLKTYRMCIWLERSKYDGKVVRYWEQDPDMHFGLSAYSCEQPSLQIGFVVWSWLQNPPRHTGCVQEVWSQYPNVQSHKIKTTGKKNCKKVVFWIYPMRQMLNLECYISCCVWMRTRSLDDNRRLFRIHFTCV